MGVKKPPRRPAKLADVGMTTMYHQKCGKGELIQQYVMTTPHNGRTIEVLKYRCDGCRQTWAPELMRSWESKEWSERFEVAVHEEIQPTIQLVNYFDKEAGKYYVRECSPHAAKILLDMGVAEKFTF